MTTEASPAAVAPAAARRAERASNEEEEAKAPMKAPKQTCWKVLRIFLGGEEGNFSFSALKNAVFLLRWSREDGLQGQGDQQRGNLSAQGPPQGGEEEAGGGGGTPPPLLVESAVAKKRPKNLFSYWTLQCAPLQPVAQLPRPVLCGAERRPTVSFADLALFKV